MERTIVKSQWKENSLSSLTMWNACTRGKVYLTCLWDTKTERRLRLHVWERTEERKDETFADFGRVLLPEPLLEHLPLVVIKGHREFVVCTCKSQAKTLGKSTSKACFKKEWWRSTRMSPFCLQAHYSYKPFHYERCSYYRGWRAKN